AVGPRRRCSQSSASRTSIIFKAASRRGRMPAFRYKRRERRWASASLEMRREPLQQQWASGPRVTTRIGRRSPLRGAPRRLLASRPQAWESLYTAEIGFQHNRIALNLRRYSLGELLAEIHDDEPVGDPHHEIHIVLDQQDRHALLFERSQ